MKKQIPIFIAGAKSFREQRVALKAMANDLNKEFIDQKKDVVLHMCSYENFGDHQQEYNQFIANVADLVIFVLDGSIGTHTEEEFRLAVAEYKKDGVPKVLVFLKEFQERTPEIQKIEGLLEEAFGPNFYYISYKTDEELCTIAKERIQQHVNKYQHRISLIRRGIGAGVVVLLILASFFTAYVVNKVNHREREPMLVFVGGGSAASYLDSIYDYDVVQNTKDEQSLFINMPSGASYSLLTDWILERPNINSAEAGNNFFYPISLSASKANPKDFTENLWDTTLLTDKGIVLSYFMGYDTLCIHYYAPEDTVQIDSLSDNEEITMENLKKFLGEKNDIIYYTTRDNSGTYGTYLTTMDSIFVKNPTVKESREIFYKEQTMVELYKPVKKEAKWHGILVFGSNYYLPEDIISFGNNNKKGYRKLYVVHDGQRLRKEMYIYMPALKEKENAGTYRIPANGVRFIKNVNDTIKIEPIFKITKTDNLDKVILPIESIN